jgi:hypothetical protein
VTGNTTEARGGGIINVVQAAPETSTLSITNSTIASNSGDGGGDNLLNSSNGGTATLTFRSTLISDPQGTQQENCVSAGAASFNMSSQGYNLASDDSCSLTATADQPSTNPGLGPLANNGGPTRTMALAQGSPAVDKGISDGLTTDQRGLTRPVDFPTIPNAPGGDGSDIGAFEVQPPPVLPVAGGPTPRAVSFDASKAKGGKKAGKDPLLAVRKGRKARFSGDVSAPQDVAGCESNQTVELQRKKPKQASFTAFDQLQTDAAGNFSTKEKIKKTFEYRAILVETAACDDAASGTEKVKAKKKR